MWMKRRTTKKGAPKSKKDAIRAWKQAWDDLEQTQIQAWIERIMVHIHGEMNIRRGDG